MPSRASADCGSVRCSAVGPNGCERRNRITVGGRLSSLIAPGAPCRRSSAIRANVSSSCAGRRPRARDPHGVQPLPECVLRTGLTPEARCPMARMRNGVTPSGAMPTRTSGIAKNALSAATTTSQQAAKAAPPPTAPPCTTATVGFGRASSAASTSGRVACGSGEDAPCAPSPRAARSAPVQKWRPLPRNTTILRAVIRGETGELGGELVEHRLVERIAALGTIEPDSRHPARRQVHGNRLLGQSRPLGYADKAGCISRRRAKRAYGASPRSGWRRGQKSRPVTGGGAAASIGCPGGTAFGAGRGRNAPA